MPVAALALEDVLSFMDSAAIEPDRVGASTCGFTFAASHGFSVIADDTTAFVALSLFSTDVASTGRLGGGLAVVDDGCNDTSLCSACRMSVDVLISLAGLVEVIVGNEATDDNREVGWVNEAETDEASTIESDRMKAGTAEDVAKLGVEVNADDIDDPPAGLADVDDTAAFGTVDEDGIVVADERVDEAMTFATSFCSSFTAVAGAVGSGPMIVAPDTTVL